MVRKCVNRSQGWTLGLPTDQDKNASGLPLRLVIQKSTTRSPEISGWGVPQYGDEHIICEGFYSTWSKRQQQQPTAKLATLAADSLGVYINCCFKFYTLMFLMEIVGCLGSSTAELKGWVRMFSYIYKCRLLDLPEHVEDGLARTRSQSNSNPTLGTAITGAQFESPSLSRGAAADPHPTAWLHKSESGDSSYNHCSFAPAGAHTVYTELAREMHSGAQCEKRSCNINIS